MHISIWVSQHTPNWIERSSLDISLFWSSVSLWYSPWLVSSSVSKIMLAGVCHVDSWLVPVDSAKEIIIQIGQKASFQEIINHLHSEWSYQVCIPTTEPMCTALPATINRTYINQASFWLTFFPYVYFLRVRILRLNNERSLRGFLIVFDLAQIINLVWISFKTRFVVPPTCSIMCSPVKLFSVFGRTPRDIREWTQPPDFEYAIY